jgi:hypothetical protein
VGRACAPVRRGGPPSSSAGGGDDALAFEFRHVAKDRPSAHEEQFSQLVIGRRGALCVGFGEESSEPVSAPRGLVEGFVGCGVDGQVDLHELVGAQDPTERSVGPGEAGGRRGGRRPVIELGVGGGDRPIERYELEELPASHRVFDRMSLTDELVVRGDHDVSAMAGAVEALKEFGQMPEPCLRMLAGDSATS